MFVSVALQQVSSICDALKRVRLKQPLAERRTLQDQIFRESRVKCTAFREISSVECHKLNQVLIGRFCPRLGPDL